MKLTLQLARSATCSSIYSDVPLRRVAGSRPERSASPGFASAPRPPSSSPSGPAGRRPGTPVATAPAPAARPEPPGSPRPCPPRATAVTPSRSSATRSTASAGLPAFRSPGPALPISQTFSASSPWDPGTLATILSREIGALYREQDNETAPSMDVFGFRRAWLRGTVVSSDGNSLQVRRANDRHDEAVLL